MARTRQDYNRYGYLSTSIFPPRTGFFAVLLAMTMFSSSVFAGQMAANSRCETLDSTESSQLDPNLLLKIALQMMIQLLDDINETQILNMNGLINQGTIEGDATGLIYGYATYGLDPNLTLQDISPGIQSGEDALNTLRSNPSQIQLSPSTKGSLDSTLESMVNELKSII